MTSMLRRMIATAACSVLLAGCGMSVFGHRSDVTKPAAAKETQATSEREKPKDEAKTAKAEKPKRPSKEEARAAKLQQQALTVDHEPKRDKHAPKASAMDDAREQATLDPTQPYWPFHLAELYFDADSTAAAETALRASLARDPDYAPALGRLSRLLYDRKRHEEAVTLLEASRARLGARSIPMSPDLLAGLALHLEALGRDQAARSTLADAPHGRSGARGALVYLTLRGSHPESATELATSAVDDDPRSAVHQNNYGITRLRAGDPDAAQKAFLKAVELDPLLPGPYYNLAILAKYYRFDDVAAARWFEAYRRRDSADPDSLLQVFAKTDPSEPGGKGR